MLYVNLALQTNEVANSGLKDQVPFAGLVLVVQWMKLLNKAEYWELRLLPSRP